MNHKKLHSGRKLLALLLTAVMLLGMTPVAFATESETESPVVEEPFAETRAVLDALKKTARERGEGNTDQSNETYLIGGKEYKVIRNDFIACYVSTEDGSFTILPTASVFDPDKPASRGAFTIDGEVFVFGEIRGDAETGDGAIFVPPAVENDMIAAHYAVGDYVISQYLAITKDAGHKNAYAVKVGYGAEYFGTQASGISAEIVIDTSAGAEGEPSFQTESGAALTPGTTLSPVPDVISVPERVTGAKAFLVLKEDRGNAPSALILGEFAQLLGGGTNLGSDILPGIADSAIKLLFDESKTAERASDADKATAGGAAGANPIAVFNTNCGFYDLSPAQLMLESIAAEAQANGAAPLSEEPGAHRLYSESEDRVTIITDLPQNEYGETYVDIGDEISFAADLPNDGRVKSELSVSYGRTGAEGPETAPIDVTPDAGGICTFTVPNDIYVDAEDASNNGQIAITVHTETVSGALPLLVDNNSFVGDPVQEYTADGKVRLFSPDGTDLKHSIAALAGDTVMIELKRLVPGYMPVLEVRLTDYGSGPGSDDDEITLISAENVTIDSYAFTVPAYAENAALHIEISAVNRNDYVINRKVVQDGDAAAVGTLAVRTRAAGSTDAFKAVLPYAGLLRAKAGDTVQVPVAAITGADWFSGQSTASLSVYNLSTGESIRTQDLKTDTGVFEFTMPAANVELALNLAAKPRVTTKIVRTPDGDSDSGASLTLWPENPDRGEIVTVNINLFGSGYKLNPAGFLNVRKTGEEGTEYTNISVVYQQVYQFQMPDDGSDVTVELILDKVPDPPRMHTIATKPFAAEGNVIFGISHWVGKTGSHEIDAANAAFQAGTALDESAKTMKAAAGSPIMFYASKKVGVPDGWTLKRVLLIVGGGENAEEHVYVPGSPGVLGFDKNGDAYTFTMPDAPVTIAVEAQNTAAPDRIVTETLVEIDGEAYPYTNYQTDVGNLRTYKWNGDGTMDLVGFTNMDPVDGAFIGDQIFVAAHPMLGGSLKSITVEQEGFAPLDIKSTGSYNPHLGADVYSFHVMRGDVCRIKAVYATVDTAQVSIRGSENDSNLVFIGDRTRTLMFGRVYAPDKPMPISSARTIIELKTADGAVGDLIYTLSLAGTPGYEAGDVDLKLMEYKDGYARYELSVSAKGAGPHPSVEVYIDKADHTKRPIIESMAPNHTNMDKFNYILIKGKNLRNFVQTQLYNYNPRIVMKQSSKRIGESFVEKTYNVNPAALQVSSDGTEAKLYLKSADFTPVSPPEAPARPTFATDNEYSVHLDWHWGDNIGPNLEHDSVWTAWSLDDLRFDFKPNATYCYAVIGRIRDSVDSYDAILSESPDDLAQNDAISEAILTFECRSGFEIASSGGQTQITLKDPNSPVLVNGMLTLEPSEASGTPFTLTRMPENSVRLETKMKLVAKGTTLFSPVGNMSGLHMRFDRGTVYSSKAGATHPPTFLPYGDVTVDIFGYNGFSAKYDSIRMLPSKVQLAGGLLLQIPGIGLPLAGLTLETLQLNLENDRPGFDGVKAAGEVGGSFAIITLQGSGSVDTFKNDYRFEGEVEIPVFEARGYLELTESQRFKIPMLEAFHIQVGADKGIPLVPPVTVGYLNGFEGGIFGLASTLDYDPTDPGKPILPPLRIAGGARFQLLEFMEFWVELTAGPAYFKQSMHDMFINLKGVNFQLIEELTTEIGVYTETAPHARTRMGFRYNSRLRANLLKGIVSDIFIAEGNLNISASMEHPSYWIDRQETYQSVLSLLNAIDARFAASGNLKGILQVPPFSFLGVDYGPFRIAQVAAWFDSEIRIGAQIRASTFRVGTEVGWGPFSIAVDYDFLHPWEAPNFDMNLFSADGMPRAAIHSEAFGDGKSGGRLTIGEGIRVIADSFGETRPQTEGLRPLSDPTANPGAISVYGDAGSFTHTVTVKDDGNSHWVQAANLTAGADFTLTVYDPDGKPLALKPVPCNAVCTADQGEHAYNALRAEDGSGLIVRLDEPGEYRFTSNSEFKSWLMEADPAPAITESGLNPNEAKLSFKAEHLDNDAAYRYKVVLEKQNAAGDGTADSVILDEGDGNPDADDLITGVSTFEMTLDLADFALNDALESGDYLPAVLLYEVSGEDDPDTEDVNEELRDLISVNRIHTPVTVTNTPVASIAPGALSDLQVTAAGNESINLTFEGATVAPGFGYPADDGDPATHEDQNPPVWKPSHYLVNLYDETGKLASRSVEATQYGDAQPDAEDGTQTETPLSFTVSDALKGADGRFDVRLAGIPGGRTYTAEVTPVFATEYQMPKVSESGAPAASGDAEDDSMEAERKGVSVTRTIAVPKANPPNLAIEAFKSTKETVNGTAAYYLSENARIDVASDVPCDITVRKYSSSATVPAVKTAANVTVLQLTDADFKDRTNEIMSSGLYAITAKNAAGDTTTELVNIVIDKTAPFLLIDDLTTEQRSAVNGHFTITGSAEPGARVMSNLGHSTVGGADGRFTMQGSIDAEREEVFVTATDAAGNTASESVILVRTAGPEEEIDRKDAVKPDDPKAGTKIGGTKIRNRTGYTSTERDVAVNLSAGDETGTDADADKDKATDAGDGSIAEESGATSKNGFPQGIPAVIAALILAGGIGGAFLYRSRKRTGRT